MRVLLCDDVEDIRFMLRMSMGRDPLFEVVGEAENGLEAIEQAEALHPDLVVLDLAMPVMDGFEALPRIRQAAPGCRVIVLSGFDGPRVGSQAIALGAEAVIVKGTSVRQIMCTIKEVVGVPVNGNGEAHPPERRALVPAASLPGLLQAIPDAAMAVDADGTILAANGEADAMFGYERGALTRTPVDALVPAAARLAHARHRQDYADDPRRRTMGAGLDLRAVRSDGSAFVVDISLSPVETEYGTVTIAALRDRDERRRAV